jgi:hypothetical protein
MTVERAEHALLLKIIRVQGSVGQGRQKFRPHGERRFSSSHGQQDDRSDRRNRPALEDKRVASVALDHVRNELEVLWKIVFVSRTANSPLPYFKESVGLYSRSAEYTTIVPSGGVLPLGVDRVRDPVEQRCVVCEGP